MFPDLVVDLKPMHWQICVTNYGNGVHKKDNDPLDFSIIQDDATIDYRRVTSRVQWVTINCR